MISAAVNKTFTAAFICPFFSPSNRTRYFKRLRFHLRRHFPRDSSVSALIFRLSPKCPRQLVSPTAPHTCGSVPAQVRGRGEPVRQLLTSRCYKIIYGNAIIMNELCVAGRMSSGAGGGSFRRVEGGGRGGGEEERDIKRQAAGLIAFKAGWMMYGAAGAPANTHTQTSRQPKL